MAFVVSMRCNTILKRNHLPMGKHNRLPLVHTIMMLNAHGLGNAALLVHASVPGKRQKSHPQIGRAESKCCSTYK